MTLFARVFTARNLGRAIVAALITASPALYAQFPAGAQNSQTYDLNQYSNGSSPGWKNGNLHPPTSTYVEGDSVPFQAVVEGLDPSTTYQLKIKYNTSQNTGQPPVQHAYDYLTSYDRTVSPNPCLDKAGVSLGAWCDPLSPVTTAIPTDPMVVSAGVSQVSGVMSLFGGGSLGTLSYQHIGLFGDNSTDTVLTVTFTTGSAGAAGQVSQVFAWGGHVATQVDWGKGAASISGSSYHMWLNDLLDQGGNVLINGGPERSIQVAEPALLTVEKSTVNGNGTFNFTSTGGNYLPSSFAITTTGGSGSAGPFSLRNFGSTYTVTEAAPGGGWSLTGLTCDKNGQAIRTTDLASGTATLPSVQSGDNFTCTFTNTKTLTPALTLAKSANPTTYTAAGQVITYTYTLTNSGNTTLHAPITVTDNKVGSFTCWNSDMAPGEVQTCTATYTIAAADMSVPSVTNTAYAEATNGPKSNDATATVTNTYAPPVIPPGPSFTPAPALSITKAGTPATYDHVGQVITYTYTLKNTGNVALSGPFTVSDNKVGSFTCSTASSLAIGATATCTNTYTITSADLTGTSVVNSATGKGFYNGTAVNSDPATFSVQALHPAISVTKTAAPTSVTAPPGATVTFTYVVTNTGDTVLAPVTVTDDHLGAVGNTPSLAPGASVTFTKATFITASSPTTNVATASGTDPMGLTVSATATATISIVAGEVITPPVTTPPATVAPAPAPAPTPAPVLPFTGAPVTGKALVGSGLIGFGWLILTSSRRGRKHRR